MPHVFKAVVGSLVCSVLAACAGLTELPRGVGRLMSEAPEGRPVRFLVDGDRVAGVSVPLGPGGLGQTLRRALNAIQPGGERAYEGREWGPRGTGFRIETIYREGPQEQFRSLLLDADGSVLERSHSLRLIEVPERVLATATQAHRRDVLRVEIVSGPEVEEFYRCTTRDKIGRSFQVECDAAGADVRVARLLSADARVY